jgi:hypothetical protein
MVQATESQVPWDPWFLCCCALCGRTRKSSGACSSGTHWAWARVWGCCRVDQKVSKQLNVIILYQNIKVHSHRGFKSTAFFFIFKVFNNIGNEKNVLQNYGTQLQNNKTLHVNAPLYNFCSSVIFYYRYLSNKLSP